MFPPDETSVHWPLEWVTFKSFLFFPNNPHNYFPFLVLSISMAFLWFPCMVDALILSGGVARFLDPDAPLQMIRICKFMVRHLSFWVTSTCSIYITPSSSQNTNTIFRIGEWKKRGRIYYWGMMRSWDI